MEEKKSSKEEYEEKLAKLAESPEAVTEEELRETMNSYAAALASEFTTKVEEANGPKEVGEVTRSYFRNNSGALAAQIVWLAHNSESDSVKLSASKFGLGMAMQIEEGEKDPVRELLDGLIKNDKKQEGAKK